MKPTKEEKIIRSLLWGKDLNKVIPCMKEIVETVIISLNSYQEEVKNLNRAIYCVESNFSEDEHYKIDQFLQSIVKYMESFFSLKTQDKEILLASQHIAKNFVSAYYTKEYFCKLYCVEHLIKKAILILNFNTVIEIIRKYKFDYIS